MWRFITPATLRRSRLPFRSRGRSAGAAVEAGNLNPLRRLSLSFPKSARLFRAAEFQKLKREGTSIHGKFMVLSFLRLASDAGPRIGLITSRRVGGAVVRNRVRRRLREIVRVDRPQMVPDCWLVLIARHRAASASFAELHTEWRLLATRGRLFATQP